MMDWWERLMIPITKVWVALGTRLGIKTTGHLKLRYEVKACEYEDVHIMWKMLRKSEAEMGRLKSKKPRRHFWTTLLCAGRTPY